MASRHRFRTGARRSDSIMGSMTDEARVGSVDLEFAFAPSAGWAGVLTTVIGAVWLVQGLLGQWPLGTALDPRTTLTLSLQFERGVFFLSFGIVIGVIGLRTQRVPGRVADEKADILSRGVGPVRSAMNAVATLLLLVMVVLNFVSPPYHEIFLSPLDFGPLPQPANVTEYGSYTVSRPFTAAEGNTVTDRLTVTWTDRRTGVVLSTLAQWETYVAPESNPQESPEIAANFVVPADGSYVLVVWLSPCGMSAEACANATTSVRGWIHIESPTAYLAAQIGAGVTSTALILTSAFVSRPRAGRPVG